LEKLKQATRYDSTQQLLEKYGNARSGGGSPQSEKKKTPGSGKKRQSDTNRVLLPPPPTANIQKKPGTPQQPPRPAGSVPSTPTPQRQPNSPLSPTEEFAPNAHDYPVNYGASQIYGEPRWYDRILDALLGDDETSPKNRMALICSQCRLVNGLAPPGAKSVEAVGRWRCSSCGAWNGKEDETAKVVKAVEQADDKAITTAVPGSMEVKQRKKSPKVEKSDEDEEAGDD
jgi:hypothetical protein